MGYLYMFQAPRYIYMYVSQVRLDGVCAAGSPQPSNHGVTFNLALLFRTTYSTQYNTTY